MRLNRTEMTDPERVTLPMYPAALGILGVIFLGQSESRTQGPAFTPGKQLATWLMPDWGHPMQWWGALLLTIAVIMGLALVLHLRTVVYIYALSVTVGVIAFWMVLLFSAALQSPQVSFSSGAWLLIPVGAPFASVRGLARRRNVSA